jgi:hypothetical protein
MLSSVIGTLRVFKGLYDLSFSEDQFDVEQRELNSWQGFTVALREPRMDGVLHPWPKPPFESRSGSTRNIDVCVFPLSHVRRSLN